MDQMEDTGENFNEGRWNAEEHRIFEEALSQYGKNWKKIAEEVKTRTADQVRSHAQKYLIKKNKEDKLKESINQSKKPNLYDIYRAWAHHCMKAFQYSQLLHTTAPQQNCPSFSQFTQEKEDKDSSASTA